MTAAEEDSASLMCLNTIDGMEPDGDPQGLRLAKAAAAAFSILEEFGFRIEQPRLSNGRGGDVLARNDDVSISVTGDWYDRQLFVDIKVSGAQWIPVDRLLPELSTATRRLPPNAKRASCRSAWSRSQPSYSAMRPRCWPADRRHSHEFCGQVLNEMDDRMRTCPDRGKLVRR
jgi:hypothetical protein